MLNDPLALNERAALAHQRAPGADDRQRSRQATADLLAQIDREAPAAP